MMAVAPNQPAMTGTVQWPTGATAMTGKHQHHAQQQPHSEFSAEHRHLSNALDFELAHAQHTAFIGLQATKPTCSVASY